MCILLNGTVIAPLQEKLRQQQLEEPEAPSLDVVFEPDFNLYPKAMAAAAAAAAARTQPREPATAAANATVTAAAAAASDASLASLAALLSGLTGGQLAELRQKYQSVCAALKGGGQKLLEWYYSEGQQGEEEEDVFGEEGVEQLEGKAQEKAMGVRVQLVQQLLVLDADFEAPKDYEVSFRVCIVLLVPRGA